MGNQANTAKALSPDAETQLIAVQNDQFRQSACCNPAMPMEIQDQVFVTPGVSAKGAEFMQEAISLTGAYTAFSEEADPHGLHEMGVITVEDQKVWWRIDLYDREYAYGSDAPTDPNQTRRVLTILLPSEY